jgi:DNA-binding NtrC family response regulator
LVISDSLQDCLTYGACLPLSLYELATCSSIDAGADWVEKEDFDFVIVDQGGAEFKARRVLERGARFHPRTPILVVTHHLDLRCYLDALDLGAVDYLERPDPEDIRWELETIRLDNSPTCHDSNRLFGRFGHLANHHLGKN